MNDWIIGIDEVGRGPLAGPVTVGCIAFPKSRYRDLLQIFDLKPGRDSKKLSEKKREQVYNRVHQMHKDGELFASVAYAKPTTIDKYGISVAVKRSLDRLVSKVTRAIDCPNDVEIKLDGGLVAKPIYTNQQSIIGGDETEPIISLASIYAKVKRDRYMINAAKKYPEYEFDSNKGYGSAGHIKAIRDHGGTPIHRWSWLHNI